MAVAGCPVILDTNPIERLEVDNLMAQVAEIRTCIPMKSPPIQAP